ncbi:hypothetical protein YPPY113_3019, partial [Yersinia pestis PY-113]
MTVRNKKDRPWQVLSYYSICTICHCRHENKQRIIIKFKSQ